MAGGQLSTYGAAIYQGQRFFSPTSDAWNPTAVGPVRSTVPAPIPTTAAPMNAGPSLSGKGGAMVNPIVIFVGLAASLLLLHYVHFRG